MIEAPDGYTLIPTNRIKRLSYRQIVHNMMRPDKVKEYVDQIVYNAIAGHIVDELREHNKLYVRFRKEPMENYKFHIEYAYQIDVIIPEDAPIP